MRTTQGSVASKLFGPDLLQEVVKLYSGDQSNYYSALVNQTIDTKQKYIEMLQMGEFGMAPVIDEGTRIGYDDFDTPGSKQYTPVKRALGFYVTEEARESDRYQVIRNGMLMAQAFNKTLEQVVANQFVNNATSTNSQYTGWDSVALSSDSHPLASGFGDNNSTDAFGPITIETGIQDLAAQKSHRGDPMPDMGPFTLVTGTGLMGIANRVTKAEGLQGTPDNDPNWSKTAVTDYSANPYVTSATAWVLKSKKWKSFLIVKRPLTSKSQFDVDYDAEKFVTTTIYLPHHGDWRGYRYASG